ncbi:GNAT family N-acetyltransferase [Sporolactobacillus laevolacticus]|uniref:GCN5 family acetyltransferase n=1 Tax=Sporolactobacillus laevolacticus DSM 442 TaxID=1395513 RepID=V6J3X7_9BACL|nr:GNAT family protein [Sporolactobacillus laevolacticus]EST11414.1 GCN5 family acetyltransferase [Sporolactobacillus laevolacticus DSM 442]
MVYMAGTKVVIRDWKLEDSDDYIFWWQPGQYWQKFDGPYYPRMSKEEVIQRVEEQCLKIKEHKLETPRRVLAIADKDSDKLLGRVSWYWESKETNWLCAGIGIFDPDYWGNGRGFEAFGLWTDYLFQAMPEIVRVDLRTWSGNHGMMKLAEKLGYTKEACFRKARIVDGKYYDSIGYGVLREEWETMHPEGFENTLVNKH